MQHQAAQDGVVGHHEHGVVVAMARQQPIGEATRLLQQFGHRQKSAAVGALQLQGLGGFAPAALLLRVEGADLAAQQAAPRGQVDLQQIVVVKGAQRRAMAGQQGRRRGAGPLQRRAVDSVERQFRQSLSRTTGLELPVLGEIRKVVTALDAVLQVEAAQPMADQHDAKGQGACGAGPAIVWERGVATGRGPGARQNQLPLPPRLSG